MIRRLGSLARTRISRRVRRDSEAAHFSRFRKACRKNDPALALRSLLSWLDHVAEVDGAATLGALVAGADDPELAPAIASSRNASSGPEGPGKRVEWEPGSTARCGAGGTDDDLPPGPEAARPGLPPSTRGYPLWPESGQEGPMPNLVYPALPQVSVSPVLLSPHETSQGAWDPTTRRTTWTSARQRDDPSGEPG